MRLGSHSRILLLALCLPELSQAIGLGSLRVASKLNEALSAQIDIVDATPAELKALRVAVANPEIFQRYNAERPAFLSTATVSVGTDAAGRPVLNIQSTEAFTEPLVEFLLDVRCGPTELVRDYSLLLDPPGAAPATATAAAASPALPPPSAAAPRTMQTVVPAAAASALIVEPLAVRGEQQYLVVAHDTLRGIVRHAGARSEAQQQRMMMAIFKANPRAFAGNINLMRRGALITIPQAATIEAFDGAEAEREVHEQMRAWRRSGPAAPGGRTEPVALTPRSPMPPQAKVPAAAETSTLLAEMDQLDERVRSVQQSLAETTRQLALANARLSTMERLRRAPPAATEPATTKIQTTGAGGSLSAMLGALAVMAGGLALAFRRFLPGRFPVPDQGLEYPTLPAAAPEFRSHARRPMRTGAAGYSVSESQPEPASPAATAKAADYEATLEMTRIPEDRVDTVQGADTAQGRAPDTLALQILEPTADQPVRTQLDYNLSDLDGSAPHVEMTGSLHEHVVVVERRKNIVDTLMAALQRDPTRNDLRMKLLETLFTAADSNLRTFKQVVAEVATHPEWLKDGEWEQIIAMGRHIGAGEALFAGRAEDDVADCA